MGRLAKWLRLMGFDTLLETDYPNGVFAGLIGPGRIFLTRTRRALANRSAYRTVFIHANDPMEQLAEVIRGAGIRQPELRPFSRCLRCNEPIAAVAKEEIARGVPDYVLETQGRFNRCSKCGRVYWPGSHTARSLRTIERMLKTV